MKMIIFSCNEIAIYFSIAPTRFNIWLPQLLPSMVIRFFSTFKTVIFVGEQIRLTYLMAHKMTVQSCHLATERLPVQGGLHSLENDFSEIKTALHFNCTITSSDLKMMEALTRNLCHFKQSMLWLGDCSVMVACG